MATSAICSIPDCGKPISAKGWCKGHYLRWYRHGDPRAGGTFIGYPEQFLKEVAFKHEADECLFWPFGHNSYGYAVFQCKIVSRLVCEETHGPPPPKADAAHSCGKGAQGCIAKAHLSWKSRAANLEDKKEHGTHIFGEQSNLAKLSEADVREIRELAAHGNQRNIAEMFGINQSTVSDIKRRKSWAHLD